MGLASVFKALGPEFLTNENGKHLFLLARESYVFALGTIGVTRFHPHLHGKIYLTLQQCERWVMFL